MFDQRVSLFDQKTSMFDQTMLLFDQKVSMFGQTLSMFDEKTLPITDITDTFPLSISPYQR